MYQQFVYNERTNLTICPVHIYMHMHFHMCTSFLECECRGFKAHLRQLIFTTASGELCSFALFFCCVTLSCLTCLSQHTWMICHSDMCIELGKQLRPTGNVQQKIVRQISPFNSFTCIPGIDYLLYHLPPPISHVYWQSWGEGGMKWTQMSLELRKGYWWGLERGQEFEGAVGFLPEWLAVRMEEGCQVPQLLHWMSAGWTVCMGKENVCHTVYKDFIQSECFACERKRFFTEDVFF